MDGCRENNLLGTNRPHNDGRGRTGVSVAAEDVVIPNRGFISFTTANITTLQTASLQRDGCPIKRHFTAHMRGDFTL